MGIDCAIELKELTLTAFLFASITNKQLDKCAEYTLKSLQDEEDSDFFGFR